MTGFDFFPKRFKSINLDHLLGNKTAGTDSVSLPSGGDRLEKELGWFHGLLNKYL